MLPEIVRLSKIDVDTIKALRDHVCSLAAAEYGKNYDSDVSIRVITDHVRSVTFMISDGIKVLHRAPRNCPPFQNGKYALPGFPSLYSKSQMPRHLPHK